MALIDVDRKETCLLFWPLYHFFKESNIITLSGFGTILIDEVCLAQF